MEAAEYLRDVRRQLDLDRATLARLGGVSPSTIGRIEKLELDPTWGTFSGILEAAGFQISGTRAAPTGNPSAAVAARFVLDAVFLEEGPRCPGLLELEVPETMAEPDRVRLWWERWQRAGWLSATPTLLRLSDLVRSAVIISGPGRRAMPGVTVGDGRRWRELALRIDEAGFDYAVSENAAALESPGAGYSPIPRIYVLDPEMVASVLHLEHSAPGQGVPLIAADAPELDDPVSGHALRLTSPGQAIIDGLIDTHASYWKVFRLLKFHELGTFP